MNIILYSGFYKRRNSTKQPSGGTAFTVALKENTSMMRPHFLIHTVDWSWNYAQWGPRYYYVTDIVSESNNLFRVECELDTLATFRADIGAYSTLISRASNNGLVGAPNRVVDNVYPARMGPEVRTVNYSTTPFTLNRNDGFVVMGTVGSAGLKFYLFSWAAFTAACAYIFPLNLGDLEDWLMANLTQAAVGGLNTIMQSIILLKWIPVLNAPSGIGVTPVSTLYIGQWQVSIGSASAYEITGNAVKTLLNDSLEFLPRSDAGARGLWLYQQPFASYSIKVPPFGNIPVDGSRLYFGGGSSSAYVNIKMDMDISNGNLVLLLEYPAVASFGQSAEQYARYTMNLGFDLKASGASADVAGVAVNGGAAVAAIATENYAAAIGAIASAANKAIPTSSSVGSGLSGPTPDLTANRSATAVYFDAIEENLAEIGRPVAEVVKISDYPGYIQTAAAKLAIPGHAEEMVEVNNMLNSGIFYE